MTPCAIASGHVALACHLRPVMGGAESTADADSPRQSLAGRIRRPRAPWRRSASPAKPRPLERDPTEVKIENALSDQPAVPADRRVPRCRAFQVRPPSPWYAPFAPGARLMRGRRHGARAALAQVAPAASVASLALATTPAAAAPCPRGTPRYPPGRFPAAPGGGPRGRAGKTDPPAARPQRGPACQSRSRRRMTLPVVVSGSSDTNSNARGYS